MYILQGPKVCSSKVSVERSACSKGLLSARLVDILPAMVDGTDCQQEDLK